MVDKKVTAKFDLDLSNLIHENQNNSRAKLLLESYFALNSAQLNPFFTGNRYYSCFKCKVLDNWTVETVAAVAKGQGKRQKQILKLRKIKKRNKKQDNLLRKLLDRKNGFQKLTCRLCGYILKKPPIREITEARTPENSVKSNKVVPADKAANLITKSSKKKKSKNKTAGLNPLYVKSKQVPASVSSSSLSSSQSNQGKKTFQNQRNLDKLSAMLKHSKTNSDFTNKNKMNLLLQ